MELIRGIHNIKPYHRDCVLTIGNFDGVHQGHCRVLKNAKNEAKKLNLPLTVMVFEPQPQELFSPANAPARLYRLRDKYTHLSAMGVDRLLCVNFNHRFAAMTAENFIQNLIVNKLGVKFLIVGDDFRFGKGRGGDFNMLNQAGESLGFDVKSTTSYRLDDCRVSSTAIRTALLNDQLDFAEAMLGRPYSIAGRVAHGDKKGRTIGFPTANIHLKRCVSPVNGVYAVEVKLGNRCIKGVANIGNRPTVAGIRQQLEVHLFNFNDDIYGCRLEVILRHKLREEQKFESFNALKEQIALDVLNAKHVLV
ncbi:bifunctional riboflavin kinase/FAD synthetase [Flocculibacter collagenilyticus]|uniref:bifunctional riboflavin kinase/FAD synthetase n=1 Tax=Flocculibacter collagenilyticus TaxID=2744479 RepID=UPI0018F4D26F|nr:bifunctional riboflavin kinase/FAD synthetase [Flocculibacter collagenilyticus]